MSFSFRMINPPEADPSYKPLVADAPDYYQVNSIGMEILYTIMSAGSMLDEDCEPPNFDEALPEWMDEERVEEVMDALELGDAPDPPLTNKEREAIAQARLAQKILLQVQSPTSGRVPAFKFGSNDGWVITPKECAIITSEAARIRADPELLSRVCPTGERRLLLESWAEFVRVAETADGLTVS